MKQIIQNFKTGETILEEVPVPQAGRGQVLIQTTRSLVSLGTERMLVEFGKASLIAKARQQPEKVKMVLDKIKSDGLLPTLETVFNKLEQPLPLGYCNVGKVVEVGAGVSDFKVGDRVISNGQHAEFVNVPQHLVAHIPNGVSDEEASFTVIGSIGLQGIRLLAPNLGETVTVIGLGLIGLLTAELLMANGCRVIGIDLDEEKIKIAQAKGIYAINSKVVDPVGFAMEKTNGVGVDGVIITASAKTDAIISQAARMSRKRGKIILVGVIGLQLSRAEFYNKELSFQVSCSFGPGRYDDDYEQKSQDYPIAFVRWTEQRNFQAVLQAIAGGQLDVKPLISEQIDLADYQKIYGNIGQSTSIASILVYSKDAKMDRVIEVKVPKSAGIKGELGIIGAGNFTKMTLLPALKKVQAKVRYIAGAGGVNATALAQKHGIQYSTTDYKEMLKDEALACVIISTRHHLHAPMVLDVLAADKHVFVEKPLALQMSELEAIEAAYTASKGTLTIGYNRRFSPHIQKIKSLLDPEAPKNIVATMNAGFIPPEVWVHDMTIGGGRIIGEACHFIDLMIFLTGSKVRSVCMSAMGENPPENTDNAIILLKFENGDQGVVNYFANGSKAYSKEKLEVYSQEKTLILDNFRELKAYSYKGFSNLKTRLDKGHQKQFELLVEGAKNGDVGLIPFDELVNSTKASFAAITSLKNNSWINIE